MRDDAFRAFLEDAGYTPKSIDSRLSRCRAVERRLGIDLDAATLDETSSADIRIRLTSFTPTAAVLANQMNAVRTYARFRGAAPDRSVQTRSDAMPNARDPRFTDRSVFALMRDHASILDELRHRGILRTGNGPIGDYAEILFKAAFGWKLEPNSTAGHDARDAAGDRYQIKARRVTAANLSRQLGALRRLPDRGFDMLAAVLFDADVAVMRAALIPYDVVVAIARRVEATNSWRIMLVDKVWLMPGVVDVTESLRAAQRTT